MKAFQFYDTTLDDFVENAFQALCLDEKRAAFSPALWEKTRDCTTVSVQISYTQALPSSSRCYMIEPKAGLVPRRPFQRRWRLS